MRGSLAGPRVLLRRLREAMAERISAQERLDKIVTLIAANMVAEVCSIYVLRADGVLELYATEGLNKAAVHDTSLQIGEGLVGLIAAEAQPLNLSNAQSHPAFAYRPETGEEIYHSFLGVPILRAGRTLGVLVVQNRTRRVYTEEEEEALHTTAMVLAEMIAAGGIASIGRAGIELDLGRPMHFVGAGLVEGIGLGHVVLHEPRVVVTHLIAENVYDELERLDAAIASLRLSVDDMLARGEVAESGEHRDVLEAYRMFAYDHGWARRMHEAVETGLTAEAAVERVQSDMRARLMRQTDPYIRERLHDFDDLANRLLRDLMGAPHVADMDLPQDAIIVARNMGAAELLDYNRDKVRGLLLEEGGPTSHVAIVARALDIPTVGQIPGVVSLAEAGDAIIIDGDAGQVHLRPTGDIENAYADKVRFRARRQEQYLRLRDKPSVTTDGIDVKLKLNAGLLVDLEHLNEAGATGIGLFRTELQFMVASSFPRISEQENLYRRVIDMVDNQTVVFRTLDIGGDKVLPYIRTVAEENPAMGWRAIRLGLDRPGLLRTQLRALLHAAGGRELSLMFPMITEVGEFDRAKVLLEREIAHLERHDHSLPRSIRVGAMIEVPALLYQLDELFARVDFASIGSNDLHQFMMASDRGNTRLANRFDALSAGFLRAMKSIIDHADAAGKPVTVCGEMAGKPLEAMALVGLGYRYLSMAPSAVGPVKAMVHSLSVEKLKGVLDPLLENGGAGTDIRQALTDFADAEGIPH